MDQHHNHFKEGFDIVLSSLVVCVRVCVLGWGNNIWHDWQTKHGSLGRGATTKGVTTRITPFLLSTSSRKKKLVTALRGDVCGEGGLHF